MEKELKEYCELIKNYIDENYQLHFQDAIPGVLNYPFFSSGINYSKQVWDWGSWQASISFRSIKNKRMEECQKGIILNFLEAMNEEGKMPILVTSGPTDWMPKDANGFKPCLALHTLEICEKYGDFAWINDKFEQFERFISYYDKYQKDDETGLYYWIDDFAIGTDNDPTVFYRPNKSTGHILLNSLMYSELNALSILASKTNHEKESQKYKKKAEELKEAIRNECFDKVDGYFYSADLSLRKVDSNTWLHSGHPRFWRSLPIKITTWAGMMPLWNKIATKEEADACVRRYLKPEGLYSEFGIRSLGKNEKMYAEVDSGNPSCWLGPVWINANYFTYIGLKNYGYDELAKELAIKTIKLLGKDLKDNGGFHEYYDSNTGVGLRGLGMHGWNFLALELISDLEKE